MLFLLMVALADLQNARLLARKNTIVIMDDTMYTVGPTQAWLESDKMEMGKECHGENISYK